MKAKPTPVNEGFLEEVDGHSVYYAEYGNTDGPKILTLHGGPGDHTKVSHVMAYDLTKYHVIGFDQRGCGKSQPAARVLSNSTQDLIKDIERLRVYLSIDSWFVAGGSWGTTLALVYAQTFPDKVRGLMMSSVFLGDSFEIEWAFTGESGVAKLFPDLWDKRQSDFKKFGVSATKAAEFFSDKLRDGDEEEKKHIIASIMSWEGNLLSSYRPELLMSPSEVDQEAVNYATVYLHYEAHNFFLADKQIIENISAIKHIPIVMIHGRYDVLCPAVSAWEIHKAHSNARLEILPQSHHSFGADGQQARKFLYEAFLLSNE
jgi:proline iminopeptidase